MRRKSSLSFARTNPWRVAPPFSSPGKGGEVLRVATPFSSSRASSSSFSSSSTQPSDGPVLDLHNTAEIYRSKTTPELMQSLLILSMCQFQSVVTCGSQLLELSSAAAWKVPAYWVMKHTFFPHFCSGESLKESREVIKRFSRLGVAVIPDYSVEEAELPSLWEKNLSDRINMLDACATKLKGLVKFSPLKVFFKIVVAFNINSLTGYKLGPSGAIGEDDKGDLAQATQPVPPHSMATRRRVCKGRCIPIATQLRLPLAHAFFLTRITKSGKARGSH